MKNTEHSIRPGDVISDKYEIDQILGKGGMGVVVAATNRYLQQRVALKFPLPELLCDPALVERFLREARTLARLRSEHVCRVYDVGLENGAPFMVMELLHGRDLGSIMSSNGALPFSLAADCVLQTAVGLAEAHALGIVHRDLKPTNLFVTKGSDGTRRIKIIDFGTVKVPATRTQSQLTRPATIIGTPSYCSPEQLRSGSNVDPRTDIWALGVILYELVSGRLPFVGRSITELTLRVALDPPPPLPGVPRAFEQIVMRCLEKEPRRRYSDVLQLATALTPFAIKRVAKTAIGSMLSTTVVDLTASTASSNSAPITSGSSSSALSISMVGRAQRSLLLLGSVVAGVLALVALV